MEPQHEERRLTTILAADVVGYSRIGAAGYKLMRSLARHMDLVARPAQRTRARGIGITLMHRPPKPP